MCLCGCLAKGFVKAERAKLANQERDTVEKGEEGVWTLGYESKSINSILIFLRSDILRYGHRESG